MPHLVVLTEFSSENQPIRNSSQSTGSCPQTPIAESSVGARSFSFEELEGGKEDGLFCPIIETQPGFMLGRSLASMFFILWHDQNSFRALGEWTFYTRNAF